MKKSIITLLLVSLAMAATAQTENPRGIYKMMTLTGKVGEVKAPYEQYKVCTDSVTLMVSFQNAFFSIGNQQTGFYCETFHDWQEQGEVR